MGRVLYLFAIMSLVVCCKNNDGSAPSGLLYSPSAYEAAEGVAFASLRPSIKGTMPVELSLDNDYGEFNIDAVTGIITLADGHSLKAGKYLLDIKASNKVSTIIFPSVVEIDVREVPDINGIQVPSELLYNKADYRLEEKAGFISVQPETNGDGPFHYSLTDDYGFFEIDAGTGVVSLKNGHGLGLGVYEPGIMVKSSVRSVVFENVLKVEVIPSLPAALTNKNYGLVWNDEFQGASLDMKKWNYRGDGSKRGYATITRDNIVLDGKGNLAVRITKKNGEYFVGMIGTEKLYETTFGYFECRAKLQQSVGPHSAFWLQSPAYGKTGNPAADGAEIDVFEYLRDRTTTLYRTVHWNAYGSDTYTNRSVHINKEGIGEGFHTFGVEWTEEGYTFYVDGDNTGTITEGVSKTKEYIVLSLILNNWGGGGDGIDVGTATTVDQWNFPDEVLFDYVRVFQIKE